MAAGLLAIGAAVAVVAVVVAVPVVVGMGVHATTKYC